MTPEERLEEFKRQKRLEEFRALKVQSAQPEQKEEEPKYEASILDDVSAGLSKLTSGLTLGFGDEVDAFGRALSKALQGEGFDYQAGLDAARGNVKRFSEENPNAAFALEASGAALSPINYMGPANTASTTLSRGLEGLTRGGLEGALYDIGSSEESGIDRVGDLGWGTVLGMVGGGTVGGATGLAANRRVAEELGDKTIGQVDTGKLGAFYRDAVGGSFGGRGAIQRQELDSVLNDPILKNLIPEGEYRNANEALRAAAREADDTTAAQIDALRLQMEEARAARAAAPDSPEVLALRDQADALRTAQAGIPDSPEVQALRNQAEELRAAKASIPDSPEVIALRQQQQDLRDARSALPRSAENAAEQARIAATEISENTSRLNRAREQASRNTEDIYTGLRQDQARAAIPAGDSDTLNRLRLLADDLGDVDKMNAFVRELDDYWTNEAFQSVKGTQLPVDRSLIKAIEEALPEAEFKHIVDELEDAMKSGTPISGNWLMKLRNEPARMASKTSDTYKYGQKVIETRNIDEQIERLLVKSGQKDALTKFRADKDAYGDKVDMFKAVGKARKRDMSPMYTPKELGTTARGKASTLGTRSSMQRAEDAAQSQRVNEELLSDRARFLGNRERRLKQRRTARTNRANRQTAAQDADLAKQLRAAQEQEQGLVRSRGQELGEQIRDVGEQQRALTRRERARLGQEIQQTNRQKSALEKSLKQEQTDKVRDLGHQRTSLERAKRVAKEQIQDAGKGLARENIGLISQTGNTMLLGAPVGLGAQMLPVGIGLSRLLATRSAQKFLAGQHQWQMALNKAIKSGDPNAIKAVEAGIRRAMEMEGAE